MIRFFEEKPSDCEYRDQDPEQPWHRCAVFVVTGEDEARPDRELEERTCDQEDQNY